MSNKGKKRWVLVAMALLLGGAGGPLAAAGPASIEGSWLVTVALEDPPAGFPASFTALESYSRGGAMVTSNDMAPFGRPGQGAWKRAGDGYRVGIAFLLVGPDGSRAGTVLVSHTLEVDGNDYAGQGEARIYDPAGQLVAASGFATTADRIRP